MDRPDSDLYLLWASLCPNTRSKVMIPEWANGRPGIPPGFEDPRRLKVVRIPPIRVPPSRKIRRRISTVTGEELVLFTLAESPHFREIKKKK